MVLPIRKLQEKVRFSLWCLNQSLIEPSWTPKRILELCMSQHSNLISLKVLGGLHLVKETEIPSLLENEPSSLNIFKSFSAILKFIHFLFKCFRKLKTNISLDEVEHLVQEIDEPKLGLQVLEDMFSICFLQREDILFEETASDSDDRGEIGDSTNYLKKSSDPCHSISNSPNSQTGTSSPVLTEKKDHISLGFLCQNSEKLQVTILMEKKRMKENDS